MSYDGIRSGDLKRRITLQTRLTTQDSFGQQSVSWTTVLNCWADIQPASGRELVAANAQQTAVTHAIVIRYRPNVTPAMRALYEGRIFEIVSVLDAGMQHRRLQLMCSEGLNQG